MIKQLLHTTDEIGATLGDIKNQLLKVRGIMIKVDDMYDTIRDDMVKGDVDEGTENSDQHYQAAMMHLKDSIMLINHELNNLEVIDDLNGDINE